MISVIGNDISLEGLAKGNAERTEQNAEVGTRKRFSEILAERSDMPYGHLAKDGIISHNGVTIVCDYKEKSLNIGNTADRKNTLSIPLSGGGVLNVNRDNFGDLAKCMDLFSPEDRERILRAIQTDIHITQKKNEMDDEIAETGELAEDAAETTEEA